MKVLCFTFAAIVSSFFAAAQADSVHSYLDQFWSEVDDRSQASYFRVVKALPGKKFLVRDYYVSGTMQSETICTALKPKLEIVGEGTLFHENGAVQQVGHFKEERPIGLHKYWYDDGTPHKVVFHGGDGKDVYHQFWARQGQQQLRDGNGLVIEHHPQHSEVYVEIVDSVMVSMFTGNPDAADKVFLWLEKIPEYKGGYNRLVRALKSTLKYPKDARKQRIAGTVYVRFVVDKEGSVADAKLVKGIHPSCDAEALRAVMTLNNWNPGIYKGEPVYVSYVLPIRFKL